MALYLCLTIAIEQRQNSRCKEAIATLQQIKPPTDASKVQLLIEMGRLMTLQGKERNAAEVYRELSKLDTAHLPKFAYHHALLHLHLGDTEKVCLVLMIGS